MNFIGLEGGWIGQPDCTWLDIKNRNFIKKYLFEFHLTGLVVDTMFPWAARGKHL